MTSEKPGLELAACNGDFDPAVAHRPTKFGLETARELDGTVVVSIQDHQEPS